MILITTSETYKDTHCNKSKTDCNLSSNRQNILTNFYSSDCGIEYLVYPLKSAYIRHIFMLSQVQH